MEKFNQDLQVAKPLLAAAHLPRVNEESIQLYAKLCLNAAVPVSPVPSRGDAWRCLAT